MSLTSKEFEEAETKAKEFKEPPFTKQMLFVLNFVCKFPPIQRYIKNSWGGLSGQIFRCWKTEEYEKATNIAIYGLKKYHHKKSWFNQFMDHHNWWQLMQNAVDSVKYIESYELKDKVIELANSGIKPYEGHYVAYSYLEFSRWEYIRNNYDLAIDYAQKASKADDTWAEPDFILGWYGLILSKDNAEKFLESAIKKDPRILFQIANNDVCKQYPHIVNKLKSKYAIESQ